MDVTPTVIDRIAANPEWCGPLSCHFLQPGENTNRRMEHSTDSMVSQSQVLTLQLEIVELARLKRHEAWKTARCCGHALKTAC